MTDLASPDVADMARLLERAATTSALVVGDVMVDEYVRGVVERTSPEAPIPVLRVTDRSTGLGGAANVARQLVRFGASVDLAGMIGDDSAGVRLRSLCDASGVDHRLVRDAPGRTTTHKQRAVSGQQQVLRIDSEDVTPQTDAEVDALLTNLAECRPPDVVVISDYAKGFVVPRLTQGIVRLAAEWHAPVLVDPKSNDFADYRGVDVVKANRAEFDAATGGCLPADVLDASAVALLRSAMDDANGASLVVTLGALGMVVVDGDAEPIRLHQPVEAVYDVSGAGDTVISVLALALVADLSLVEAARLANLAAGLVVRKPGVAVCEVEDLLVRISTTSSDVRAPADRIDETIARWRAEGRKVVFANGCFDILHPGHLHLLRGAAAMGDALVVAVNSDASVAALKGRDRPCLPVAVRAALLESLSFVDAVVAFDEPDPGVLIKRLRPDVLVKGGDYAPEDIVGRHVVEDNGGIVATVPLLPGWSTTAALERFEPDALSS